MSETVTVVRCPCCGNEYERGESPECYHAVVNSVKRDEAALRDTLKKSIALHKLAESWRNQRAEYDDVWAICASQLKDTLK